MIKNVNRQKSNVYNNFKRANPEATFVDYLQNFSDPAFNGWAKAFSESRAKAGQEGWEDIIYNLNNDYDYKGFFDENKKEANDLIYDDPNAHFTDKYKKPNHPTFSIESKYSTPENPGGHWVGDNYIKPKKYSNGGIADGFRWANESKTLGYAPVSKDYSGQADFKTSLPEIVVDQRNTDLINPIQTGMSNAASNIMAAAGLMPWGVGGGLIGGAINNSGKAARAGLKAMQYPWEAMSQAAGQVAKKGFGNAIFRSGAQGAGTAAALAAGPMIDSYYLDNDLKEFISNPNIESGVVLGLSTLPFAIPVASKTNLLKGRVKYFNNRLQESYGELAIKNREIERQGKILEKYDNAIESGKRKVVKESRKALKNKYIRKTGEQLTMDLDAAKQRKDLPKVEQRNTTLSASEKIQRMSEESKRKTMEAAAKKVGGERQIDIDDFELTSGGFGNVELSGRMSYDNVSPTKNQYSAEVFDLESGKRISISDAVTQQGKGFVSNEGQRHSLRYDIRPGYGGKPIGSFVKSADDSYSVPKSIVAKNIDERISTSVSDQYRQAISKNISFVEREIPGAKAFGSSIMVSEAELPHITGDIDVFISRSDFEKFKSSGKQMMEVIPGSTYSYNLNPNAGEQGLIDLNIVDQNDLGLATGQRAEELFRNIYPKEWAAAKQNVFMPNDPIDIPYTPEHLMEKFDPTIKTIADAFDAAGSKYKHVARPIRLISYGNVDKVRKGMSSYYDSVLGGKHMSAHTFPKEQFKDVEQNLTILEKLGLYGDNAEIAANPERMQLALEYAFLDRTTSTRVATNSDTDNYLAPFFEWSLSHNNAGGTTAGPGLNTSSGTLDGYQMAVGNGNFRSITMQPTKPLKDLDTSSPMAYVDDLNSRFVPQNYNLSSEQIQPYVKTIQENLKIGDDEMNILLNESKNSDGSYSLQNMLTKSIIFSGVHGDQMVDAYSNISKQSKIFQYQNDSFNNKFRGVLDKIDSGDTNFHIQDEVNYMLSSHQDFKNEVEGGFIDLKKEILNSDLAKSIILNNNKSQMIIHGADEWITKYLLDINKRLGYKANNEAIEALMGADELIKQRRQVLEQTVDGVAQRAISNFDDASRYIDKNGTQSRIGFREAETEMLRLEFDEIEKDKTKRWLDYEKKGRDQLIDGKINKQKQIIQDSQKEILDIRHKLVKNILKSIGINYSSKELVKEIQKKQNKINKK